MEWAIFIVNLTHMGNGTLNWELPLLDWPGRMSGGVLPWLLIGAGGFTVGGTNLMQTRPRLCKKELNMWLGANQMSIVVLWFRLQFLLKSLPWLSFWVWPRSLSQINLIPQAAFCLVFTTATEGRLEYPPLFFLIVTLFTYGFCQTCYITVPYLFCQGVCFTTLLITLTAQPWWIYSPLSVWPIIVASHYLSTLVYVLLNFCGQLTGSVSQALHWLGWYLCFV